VEWHVPKAGLVFISSQPVGRGDILLEENLVLKVEISSGHTGLKNTQKT
jgi:hypothetical protein